MSANIETTQNLVARPTTTERLRLECNGGVVLAKDVLLSEEGTFVSWDRLSAEGVMAKVLVLEDGSIFDLIIKYLLFRQLSIKPGGLPVNVTLPIRSFSINQNHWLTDIISMSISSPMLIC